MNNRSPSTANSFSAGGKFDEKVVLKKWDHFSPKKKSCCSVGTSTRDMLDCVLQDVRSLGNTFEILFDNNVPVFTVSVSYITYSSFDKDVNQQIGLFYFISN